MRLLLLATFATALSVWLYAKHRHDSRPVSAPLLPVFDPAKPAFRTNLELLLPERGPVIVSELPDQRFIKL